MSHSAGRAQEVAVADRAQALFDEQWYLWRYPDVAKAEVDPWKHYVDFGVRENRDPNALFDTAWYRATYAAALGRDMLPLLHYWLHGGTGDFDPNPLFCGSWYRAQHAEVRSSGVNPLLHYLSAGSAKGYDPSPGFCTNWYTSTYPDVRRFPWTPLGHYLHFGCKEGRIPSLPGFTAPRVRRTNKRIAVYAAIYDGYDALQVPECFDEDCDYFCFTDADISWQQAWIRREPRWRHADPARTVRHVKLHPHLYFPEYEWSLWIDANLRLTAPVSALFPANEFDIALFHHPFRACVYEEAEACAQQRKDDPATIRAQIERYRHQQFPEHAGLTENNVLLRRHNDPALIAVADAWWREISTGSCRDQLSLPVALRAHSARVAYLGPQGASARNDPRFRFFSHIERDWRPEILNQVRT